MADATKVIKDSECKEDSAVQRVEARELARLRDAMLRVCEQAQAIIDQALEAGSVDLRKLEASLVELNARRQKAGGDGKRFTELGKDFWREDQLYPGPFAATRGDMLSDGSAILWRVHAGDGTRVWVGGDEQLASFIADALTAEACSRAHALKEAGEVNDNYAEEFDE